MATFDQRNQHVHGNQNNAETINQVNIEAVDKINFDSVQNNAEFVAELQKLLIELHRSTQTSLIPRDMASEIESLIKKAVTEVKEEPKPRRNLILKYLAAATKLLDGIPPLAGLITALLKAAEFAGKFFV